MLHYPGNVIPLLDKQYNWKNKIIYRKDSFVLCIRCDCAFRHIDNVMDQR